MATRIPLVIVNGEIQQLQPGDSLPPVLDESSNGLISGGGVFWTGNLDFTVSAATYKIAGVLYASIQTNVTLSTADPTLDRIDIIAVDNTNTVVVIVGTPAATPAAPDVDPSSQLQLTFVLVAAGATIPDVSAENIYLENTEWTTSTTGGTINTASTTNPFAGTKDIEATAAANNHKVTLVKPSGTINLTDWDSLTLQIRSKATWPSQKGLSIAWLSGTTVVGVTVVLKSGTFGFDSSNTSSYQQVTIPASSFVGGTLSIDRLRITVTGGSSNIGFYLDNIILQSGVTTPPPPGQGTRSSFLLSRTIAANGQFASFLPAFPNTFDVLSVSSSTSFSFRLRLYANQASQTADLSRNVSSPPLAQSQHGVIMDLVLSSTTGYTWVMSPLARGSISGNDGKLYYTLDNLTAASHAFLITVIYLGGET